jgi:hypothetical protein
MKSLNPNTRTKSNNWIRSNVNIFEKDKVRKDVFKNLGYIPKENDEPKKINVKGINTVMKNTKNQKLSKFQKK